MIVTAFLSFIAGLLTVLAPCVLPFLPVIVGGSLQGATWRPYVVAASLVLSLLAFTILLKASSSLLFIDPSVWTTLSGVLVIALGFTMLFPQFWARISSRFGFDAKSHEMLEHARKKQGISSAILTGAALGPVFSSCSPTYAWVIATILPVNPAEGILYLGIYCVGLALMLLAIALLGRKLIARLHWAANPTGWFQRIVAIVFIVVGLSVATGIDKHVQTALTDYSLGLAQFEETLVPLSEDERETSQVTASSLNQNWQAPEFKEIDSWINSDPLTLADLQGKVVLIDFWTYSCINCQRTQPYLNTWYEKYHDQGFEIVGVHAPEFSFEKLPQNVMKAVQEAQISYPIALDNSFATWNAYHNRYWPAKYLIDQQGHVRYTHFGEGSYDETERNIRELLGSNQEESTELVDNSKEESDPSQSHMTGQSPETYLGTARSKGFVGTPGLQVGRQTFTPVTPGLHQWSLEGDWEVSEESIRSLHDGAKLVYTFQGKEMYLVLSPPEEGSENPPHVTVEVYEDKSSTPTSSSTLEIREDTLYTVAQLSHVSQSTQVVLTFDEGVAAYAFTFGS